jgi:hypothetical protein
VVWFTSRRIADVLRILVGSAIRRIDFCFSQPAAFGKRCHSLALGQRWKSGLALWTAFAAALTAPAAGQEVLGPGPGFSEARLREGQEAYAGHRYAEAIDQLRIAAFGSLDQPARLCECLVYLALAEEAAERHTDAKNVIERLSDIWRRFPACSQARLDPGVLRDFEQWSHVKLLVSASPGSSPPSAQTTRPPAPTPTPRPRG